jgi:hypothetical protein
MKYLTESVRPHGCRFLNMLVSDFLCSHLSSQAQSPHPCSLMTPASLGEIARDYPATALPFSDVDIIELNNLSLSRPPSPPPTVPSDLSHAAIANSTRSSVWLPKVTGYRLTFVTLTIGLGTAKAAKTSDSAVSVTIEWVGGTVALLL